MVVCAASASQGAGIDDLDARLRALEHRIAAALEAPPEITAVAPVATEQGALACTIDSADAPERRERLSATFSRLDRDLDRANKRAVGLRREIMSEGCDERRRKMITTVRREVLGVDPASAAEEGDMLLECVNLRMEKADAALRESEDSGDANSRTLGLSQRMNALTEQREKVLEVAIAASSAVEFRKRVVASLDTLEEICASAMDF